MDLLHWGLGGKGVSRRGRNGGDLAVAVAGAESLACRGNREERGIAAWGFGEWVGWGRNRQQKGIWKGTWY